MALVEVDGLVRRFRGLAAVDGLSFAVEEGSTLALIGPNGAGKTTAFNLLSGLLAPNAGRVVFRGHDVTRMSADERCRLGMGRTFQVVQPFAELSTIENVMVGALFGGRAPSVPAARREAGRLCELVGRPELAQRQYDPDQQSLAAELAAVFAQRPLAVWLELFEAADVCAGPAATLAGAPADLGPEPAARAPASAKAHAVPRPIPLAAPVISTSRPPGFTTRAVSPRQRCGCGTTAVIMCSTTVSKQASTNGSAMLSPCTSATPNSPIRLRARPSIAAVRSSAT